MGWTYEVNKIVKIDDYWQNTSQYRGESLLKAIMAFLAARKESKCVTFIWRGRSKIEPITTHKPIGIIHWTL